ncbi:MAG: GIY-YIG nuclease family protein [Patescibacteria group bacterium]
MHYVYILRNNTKKTIYIGYTSDLRRRLKEHKDKKPELLYYEAYKDEKDARIRERMLKQRGQAIRWLKSRLQNSIK